MKGIRKRSAASGACRGLESCQWDLFRAAVEINALMPSNDQTPLSAATCSPESAWKAKRRQEGALSGHQVTKVSGKNGLGQKGARSEMIGLRRAGQMQAACC